MFQQIMRGIIFDLHGVHPFGSLDGFATYHASVTDRVMAKDFFGHLGSQRLTPVQCSKFKVQSQNLLPYAPAKAPVQTVQPLR